MKKVLLAGLVVASMLMATPIDNFIVDEYNGGTMPVGYWVDCDWRYTSETNMINSETQKWVITASIVNDTTKYKICDVKKNYFSIGYDSLMALIPSYKNPLVDTLIFTLSSVDIETKAVINSSEPFTFIAENYIHTFNNFGYEDYYYWDTFNKIHSGVKCWWDTSDVNLTGTQKWQITSSLTENSEETILYMDTVSEFTFEVGQAIDYWLEPFFFRLKIVDADTVVKSTDPIPYQYTAPIGINNSAVVQPKTSVQVKNNVLSLTGINGQKTISLFTVNGKLVKQWETVSNSLKLSGITRGCYVMKISATGYSSSQKIVLQ